MVLLSSYMLLYLPAAAILVYIPSLASKFIQRFSFQSNLIYYFQDVSASFSTAPSIIFYFS